MAQEPLDSLASQRLLELVYSLPAEDEAVQLRRRVADDSQWAAALAEAQHSAGLCAAATILPAPKVEYRLHRRSSLSAGRRSRAAASTHWERGAHLAIGLIATTLLVISVAAWLLQRQQLADLAAEHIRLVVCGPARLHGGVANSFCIETSTVDGSPLPTQVEFSLTPAGAADGKPLLRQKDETDREGRLHLAVPADVEPGVDLLLEVRADFQNKVERVQSRLAAVPSGHQVHLEVDRRQYRPGQTAFFRAVCLSRYGLTADREVLLTFAVRNSAGQVLAGATAAGWTKRGVASGGFRIPRDLPVGHTYELVARSSHGECAEQRQSFDLLPPDTAPAAGTAFGRDEGFSKVGAAVPDKASRHDEPLESPVPAVNVRFFPEGGSLAAGLENRIYFQASDVAGRPIELRGRIIDDSGGDCGSAATAQGGRGQFRLVPVIGKHYRLKLSSPAALKDEPRLPDVAAGQTLVLAAGEAVVEPARPLRLDIQSAAPARPLVVAAYCRGVPVAALPLAAKAGTNDMVLPLAADVCGVIRVVVYDYALQPPKPVAQRLVYRRPERRLQLSFADHIPYFAPGGKAALAVRVTNEKGESVPAVLGVTVADQQTPLAASRTGNLATRLLLADDLAVAAQARAERGPAETEVQQAAQRDACLADGPEAAAALDLLLGTSAAGALLGDLDPPAMFDNLPRLRARYQADFAAYRARRNWFVDTLTTIGFFGGFGLILLVALLTLLRLAAGILSWIPTLLVALSCVLLGAVLMNPERLKPQPSAAVAFGSFSLSPAAGEQPAASGNAQDSRRRSGGDALEPDRPEIFEPPPQQRQPPMYLNADPVTPTGLEEGGAVVYWNPALMAGTDGRARIEFNLPAADARYVVAVEAHGEGRLGLAADHLTARRPFSLQARLPAAATSGDYFRVPLEIGNGTEETQKLSVLATLSSGLLQPVDTQRAVELEIGQQQREWFGFSTVGGREAAVTFRVKNESFSDEFHRQIEITPPGYPVSRSWSGRLEGRTPLAVKLPDDMVRGSLRGALVLIPSMLAEFQRALGRREPPGGRALEPLAGRGSLAALALKYLADTHLADTHLADNGPADLPDVGPWRRAAGDLTERLDAYGVAQGGFTWFGHGPPDVGLTANVLLQLGDLAAAGLADPSLLRPHTDWLMGQCLAGGGSTRASEVQPPAPPAEVINAWALWALHDVISEPAAKEAGRLLEQAREADDPYVWALAALAAPRAQSAARNAVLQKLAAAQAADGHLDARHATIFQSEGLSRNIEATALAVLAWNGSDQFHAQQERASAWLLNNRDEDGRFGPMHATNLTLRALLAQAAAPDLRDAAGRVFIRRGDDLLAEQIVEPGQRAALVVDGWEEKLDPGENALSIDMVGIASLPYLLRISYYQKQQPAAGSPLRLVTQLAAGHMRVDRSVELSVDVSNSAGQPQPLVVATLGLPGGLEPPLDELKALEKSGQIDGFETRPREIVLYWQRLAARSEVAVKLHPRCAFPGRYTGPPSAVYRLYAPAARSWAAPLQAEVGEQ